MRHLLAAFGAWIVVSGCSIPIAGAVTDIIPPAGIPQPTQPGDIVGLVFQNIGTRQTPPLPLTFGEVFKPGNVMPGARLLLNIGKQIPVQMDPKTFNADGSVAIATLTVIAPPLPQHTATGAMLVHAPAGSPPPAADIDLAAALGHYSLTVSLTLTEPDGSTTRLEINGVSSLQAALRNRTASFWRRGPEAAEASVSVPAKGSFRLVFSITAYADGSFRSDVQFNNDLAMQPDGGTVTYGETIVQNGHTVSQHNNITQYQYQDWHQVVGTTNEAAEVNIQHDIGYLEATGAIPNFDLRLGVSASVLATETALMAKPGWGEPLSPNGITQYMPGVGGRTDIGPTTAWNAAWLMTQNPTAARFALGQADAAGAIPWHFFYPASGQYLTTNDYPNIWTQPGNPYGTTLLTQPISGDTGWALDTAHQPDLSYIPYLLTGDRYYLDQLNAQAAWCETSLWPAPEARNNGEGLVVQGSQVRGAAWSLREIVEAAYANPPGTPMGRYFRQMEKNNFSWLLSKLPAWTDEQGEAHGYLPGVYGNSGAMAPWQQDYLASTIVLAAQLGVPGAKTFLEWQSNFLVGRFLSQEQGFNPRNGIAYNPHVYDPSTRRIFKSWREIEEATEAAGESNGNGWKRSDGDYGQLALQSLAGIITITGSPRAIEAYRWLLGSGAPYVDAASLASSPQFAIIPRNH